MSGEGDWVGRTCLVTGATSGIGQVLARELARRGATVVLHGRSAERGAATLAAIRAQVPGAQVELLLADLSVQAEVRRLAAALRAGHQRLHLLLNNAGGLNPRREVTPEGLEVTFATNHLAPFLLTTLLLDLLLASAPARVVTVASRAHWRGRMHFDDLQLSRGYGGWRAYQQSKLANILFTVELARRLEGTGVVANAVHPGVVATGFGGSKPGPTRWAMRLARPFLLTAEQGARTPLWVATAKELAQVNGRYFSNGKEARPSARAQDVEAARRLWEVSERLVSAERPQ
jgi:NAD(P)-dependent dehydrogenase (short-subunit alcohol dehydrogenase family)